MSEKVKNILSSLLATLILGIALISLGAPSWGAFGIAYVAYLLWRATDAARGRP
jgi:hypothetical protein